MGHQTEQKETLRVKIGGATYKISVSALDGLQQLGFILVTLPGGGTLYTMTLKGNSVEPLNGRLQKKVNPTKGYTSFSLGEKTYEVPVDGLRPGKFIKCGRSGMYVKVAIWGGGILLVDPVITHHCIKERKVW